MLPFLPQPTGSLELSLMLIHSKCISVRDGHIFFLPLGIWIFYFLFLFWQPLQSVFLLLSYDVSITLGSRQHTNYQWGKWKRQGWYSGFLLGHSYQNTCSDQDDLDKCPFKEWALRSSCHQRNPSLALLTKLHNSPQKTCPLKAQRQVKPLGGKHPGR